MILASVIAMTRASVFTTIQPNASAQMSDAGSTNTMTDTMMEPGNMTMTMSGENVTSSINLMNIISNAIGSQIKVSLSNATMQQQSQRIQLVIIHTCCSSTRWRCEWIFSIHYLGIRSYMNFNTVIVDPGNGQVLFTRHMSMEEHSMMHKAMAGPGMMG